MLLPAGAGLTPPTRATVATSLPRDEQEVPGMVLHSGPPPWEERFIGRGPGSVSMTSSGAGVGRDTI